MVTQRPRPWTESRLQADSPAPFRVILPRSPIRSHDGGHGTWGRVNNTFTTAGIDLATEASRTGVCRIEWGEDGASVSIPDITATDQYLLALIESADNTGIDAPFGWPVKYLRAIDGWSSGSRWTADVDTAAARSHLALRETDRAAWEVVGRPPLSVSTDKIGLTAMRCASLLSGLGQRIGRPVDRVAGEDQVVEVWPAGSLAVWGLPSRRYKTKAESSLELRRAILEQVTLRFQLRVDVPTWERLLADHDTLDALICAVTARLALEGRTVAAPPEASEAVRIEGWLHLPDV